MLEGTLYTVSLWIIPMILAITLHEAAHGYVAWKLGDDTAYTQGRVTFNPLRHIDPVGTILLPALLLLFSPFVFGWARPVPVNARRLNHPRRDMVLVALAGPGINLLLALASAWLMRWVYLLPEPAVEWVAANLWNSVTINVLLAVFNMLPLPPLDGGRVAVGLLPGPLALPLARLEPFGLAILLTGLLLLPALGRQLGIDLDIFGWLILAPVHWIITVIALLMGLI